MTDPSPKTLRTALGAFATGVTVVTALDPGGKSIGMTVNSFAAVSLDPPLVLWSVQRRNGSFAAFNTASHYAVHVLHAGQQGVSNHFAQELEDKFQGIAHHQGIAGLPLLDDFTARFQCSVEQRLDGGDHVILLGRVMDIEYRPDEPLIFHASAYRS